MRVYKYNLNWQLARINNKKVDLSTKLYNMRNFLNKYPSIENKERVLNYLKGLELGYKTLEQRAMVRSTYNLLRDKVCNNKEVDISIENVDNKQLMTLYKDLYNRNEKWLKDNYRNTDLNEFLEYLYLELNKRNIKVDSNFNILPTSRSTYKFIFN